ncbi:hypothetical protein PDESU_06378 [Pontiella desulfatans]|uniref:Uncharacterized protein n=1 Tax=Pontiella desulfatans TaxID=2750659 RepID=A0A6C2UEY9_PONDE|nr:right-handed parallel beta-helix repeat-containing protein [Pontiella desulfatans]VGO17776.1 hypothetical protein PDESU_06378 [Pontiella desulfatans]
MKAFIISVAMILAADLTVLAQIAVIDENFDSLSLGDITGINQEIAGAGLRLHNHVVGEVVTPHPAFTSSSGNAFQLTTGTNPSGGWGLLSADNSPRSVSLTVGEEITLSFDMYVQAVPGSSTEPELQMMLDGSEAAVREFTELAGASVGDVIQVSWAVPVSPTMESASAISPRIGLEGHNNNFIDPGTNVDVIQIDNLKLSVVAATPNTYYLDADGGNDGNSGTSPGNAWASLSKAGSFAFSAGEQLLLQRGDTFNGKLVLSADSGANGNPVVIGAYGSGNRPVIDAAGYLAGIQITSCDHLLIQDLEITGDGGAHVDGSDGTDRYGIYINNTSGNDSDHITISNVYFHAIYPFLASSHEGHNPTTYTGYGILASGQNGNHSEYLTVVNCHFENLGMSCINMSRQNNMSVLKNLMENIGGPAMVPNRCDDLLVRGNTVDGSGQYTDPRMHGRGSGIWPINCNGVLIEKNAFMHARGRYDSCGVHLDIGNTDAIVQYNLSMDNEGGFVEILGVNANCSYRYNISINDGNRRPGVNENGLTQGSGHTILFSSHNFSEQPRHGPYNSYIYNNTIFVKDGQHASFSIEQGTKGILMANNLFYIEGELEDENPYWRGAYTNLLPGTAIWTNNLYQRGGIYPENWIFEEGNPMYGNPQFPNAGGFTPEDYIPMPGSMVEGRSVDIPVIPGDPIGLAVGFGVTEDFFGNPIIGQPDIGAVEIGGGLSTEIGSAFDHWPEEHDGTVEMHAVPRPTGAEYYFSETSGNAGGEDSGWQISPSYTDTGLLPNTLYTYTVTTRDAGDMVFGTSVVEEVMPVSFSPYPSHIMLEEDFSSTVDPDNHSSPFPENTWYLVDGSVGQENQDSSVVTTDGGLQLGFGYEEMLVQYYSDQTWTLNRDYQFSGDWEIKTLFENHLGIKVGFGEFDPVTGALINKFGETDLGDTVSPTAGETGSFNLTVTSAELQTEGVNPANRVGIYFYRDNDGIVGAQTENAKNDIYLVDNLVLQQDGAGVDTDGDSIPDSIEDSLGGLDPEGDYDADGLLNAEEILVGQPIDVAGSPVMAGMTNGTQIVVYDPWVLSNRVYILEHKEALLSSNAWKAVDAMSGSAEADNGDYAFPNTGTDTQAFYRIRVEWE